MNKLAKFLLLLSVLLCSTAQAQGPNVLLVNSAATGANSGLSWEDAFTNLQSALALASIDTSYTEIWVAAGTYSPAAIGGDRNASFLMPSNVTVLGGFLGGETSEIQRLPDVNTTILSGDLNGDDSADPASLADNSYHVVTVLAGTGASTVVTILAGTGESTVDGFVITGGFAEGAYPANSGAGVHVNQGNLTLVDCIIMGNAIGDGGNPGGFYEGGGYGGGIFVTTGTLTMVGCEIRANSTGQSGVDLVNEIGPRGGHGGGLALVDSQATILESIIINNQTSEGGPGTVGLYDPAAGGFGGGVFSQNSSLEMMNCTISVNSTGSGGPDDIEAGNSPTSGLGGGIFAQDGSVILQSCIIQGNSTGNALVGGEGGPGGGIFFESGSHSIDRCLITLNQTGSGNFGGFGGGLAIDVDSVVVMQNNYILQNSTGAGSIGDGLGGGIFTASPLNLIHCTVADNASGGTGQGIATFVSPLGIQNSIVWNNDILGAYTSTFSDVEGSAFSVDPKFRGPNDYRLYPDSPCIDQAPLALPIDYDGQARGYDGDGVPSALEADMGADEAVYPLISVSAIDSDAEEPAGNNGIFRITREGVLSGSLPIYGFWSGTATKHQDFRTFAFPILLASNDAQTPIQVKVIDDELLEGDEFVSLNIVTTANYRALTTMAPSVVIDDNEDEPAVSCVAIDAIASEPGRNVGMVRVSRAAPFDQPMTFYYGWVGSATKNQDYRANARPVTIPAGVGFVDMQVSPIDDLILENDEVATLVLTARNHYSLDPVNRTASVTIMENDDEDPVSVSKIQDGYESGFSNGRVRFTREGDLTDPLRVWFQWGGTAMRGTDYRAATQSLTIPPGIGSVDVVAAVLDDEIFEGDETAICTLLPGEFYSVGTGKEANVVIHDDEDDPIVTIAVIDGNASEVGPDAGVLQLLRTGLVDEPLVVNCRWMGTAQKSVDFSTLATPITMIGSATNVVINPFADALVEGAENVQLELLPGTNYKIGTPDSGLVQILDSLDQ